ncbi:hypothetical protein AB0M57_31845 [Streptomyces sp. NPDC051597]|uniref:hypothetical protein n=1 Tax=Streptomyces sp. NPDC051597 TaxID=3155049 RepID=UPI0034305264
MSWRLIDAVAAPAPAETEFAATAAVRRVAAGEVGLTCAVANLALADQTHAITICTAVTRLEAHGRLRALELADAQTREYSRWAIPGLIRCPDHRMPGLFHEPQPVRPWNCAAKHTCPAVRAPDATAGWIYRHTEADTTTED